MATYAIGDIQGCFDELLHLLNTINFNPVQDRLWLVGDLVNRGPNSLAVIQFLYELTPSPIIVLGNHDLHLLAVWSGAAQLKVHDTFNDILESPNCDKLCHWLRNQKILHYDPKLNYLMAHAGIAPMWDLATARRLAEEVEQVLHATEHYSALLNHMYGNLPVLWNEQLTGWARLRVITNYFTRMRFCSLTGELNLEFKRGQGSQPNHLIPWFKLPNRGLQDIKIIFGHWAAIQGITNEPNAIAIDTGCVWGGPLTALRLEDGQRFVVKSQQKRSRF